MVEALIAPPLLWSFTPSRHSWGVSEGLTILGASGTVTAQNINAIGAAAEGFITGVGYSVLIDSPENKAFTEAFRERNGADPDLSGQIRKFKQSTVQKQTSFIR